MKRKSLLLLLVMLTGCQAREAQTPEQTGAMPYGKWGFAFFTFPVAYRVVCQQQFSQPLSYPLRQPASGYPVNLFSSTV